MSWWDTIQETATKGLQEAATFTGELVAELNDAAASAESDTGTGASTYMDDDVFMSAGIGGIDDEEEDDDDIAFSDDNVDSDAQQSHLRTEATQSALRPQYETKEADEYSDTRVTEPSPETAKVGADTGHGAEDESSDVEFDSELGQTSETGDRQRLDVDSRSSEQLPVATEVSESASDKEAKLKQRCSEQSAEIDRLRAEVTSLKSTALRRGESEELQSANVFMVAKLQETVSKLREERKTAKLELTELNELLQDKEEVIANLNERNGTLSEENTALHETLADNAEMSAELKGENKSLSEMVRSLTEKLTGLKEERLSFDETIARLNADNAQLNDDLQSLVDKHTELQQEYSDYRQEMEFKLKTASANEGAEGEQSTNASMTPPPHVEGSGTDVSSPGADLLIISQLQDSVSEKESVIADLRKYAADLEALFGRKMTEMTAAIAAHNEKQQLALGDSTQRHEADYKHLSEFQQRLSAQLPELLSAYESQIERMYAVRNEQVKYESLVTQQSDYISYIQRTAIDSSAAHMQDTTLAGNGPAIDSLIDKIKSPKSEDTDSAVISSVSLSDEMEADLISLPSAAFSGDGDSAEIRAEGEPGASGKHGGDSAVALNLRVDIMEKAVAVKQDEIDVLRKSVRKLSEDLRKCELFKASVANVLTTEIEVGIRQNASENEALIAQLSQLTSELKQWRATVSELKATHRTQLEALEKSLSGDCEEKCKKLRTEKRDEVSSLQTQLSVSNAANGRLKEKYEHELDALRETVSGDAADVNRRHSEEMETLRSQLHEFEATQRQLNELSLRIDSMQQTHAQNVEDLQQSHAEKVDALQKNHLTKMSELQGSHEENVIELQENHEESVAGLRQSHSQKVDELLRTHNQKVTELQGTYEQTVADLKQSLEASSKDNSEGYEEQISELTDRLSEASKEWTQLQTHSGELQQAYDALQSEAERYKSELEESKSELEQSQRALRKSESDGDAQGKEAVQLFSTSVGCSIFAGIAKLRELRETMRTIAPAKMRSDAKADADVSEESDVFELLATMSAATDELRALSDATTKRVRIGDAKLKETRRIVCESLLCLMARTKRSLAVCSGHTSPDAASDGSVDSASPPHKSDFLSVIKEFECAIDSVVSAKRAVESECDSFRNALEEARMEAQELIDDEQQRADRLERELQTATRKCEVQKATNESLLSEMRLKMRDSAAVDTDTMLQMQSLQRERDSLTETLRTVTEKHHVLAKEKDEELIALSAELSQLKLDNESLSALEMDFIATKQMLNESEERLGVSEEQLQNVKGAFDALQTEVVRIKKERDELRVAADDAKKRSAAVVTVTADGSAESGAVAELKRAQGKYESTLRRLKDTRSKLTAAQKYNMNLEAENASLRQGLSKTLAKLKQFSVGGEDSENNTMVDRRLVNKLLSTYVLRLSALLSEDSSAALPKRQNELAELSRLMANILAFSAEEKRLVEAAIADCVRVTGGGGIWQYATSWMPFAADVEATDALATERRDSRNLADLWVDFLLTEMDNEAEGDLHATAGGSEHGDVSSALRTVEQETSASPMPSPLLPRTDESDSSQVSATLDQQSSA